MKLPVNQIEQAAAEWAAKVDGNTMPSDQKAAFEAWLAADPRHLGAYLKVEAALARVTRLGGEAAFQHETRVVVSFDAQRQRRRRFMLAGAIAASLVAVLAGGAVWKVNSYDAVYATRIGETRTVSLPDGSSIVLNTDSSAHVRYGVFARDVTLERGEVLFNVAKHKSRPFVVAAGDFAVRAVGTSFTVNQVANRPFAVTVREGTVAITQSRQAGATMVSAGFKAVAQAGGALWVGANQSTQDFAWLDGRVIFRHKALATAVREFDRYSPLRIVIEDPSIASRTVTGSYVASDPAGFAQAVAVFMDLQLETVGAKIYLKHKKA